MPTTSDVLDDARDLVKKRLAELEEEKVRLERALKELGGAKSGRRPGRPKGSTSKGNTGAKKGTRRRRRRGGTRADQAVKLIADNPGISASEIAKTMKIKPNYLYRVLGDLEKEKKVKKDGRSYSAA
jgi:DNA invertase Pin-like site-specific DNA recombinase